MQNIVATVNLGSRVVLVRSNFFLQICELIWSHSQDRITQTARNAEYNPKRFQAVIMRVREPKSTALIFASGKVFITIMTSTDFTC